MRRVRKINLLLFILISLSFFVTVGYAALQTTLNINGTSEIKSNNWDVHFENINVVQGSVKPVADASIINATTISFDAPLLKVGDFYMFDVDVVNEGTIDAMIGSISKTPVLTAEQSRYLTYEVSYKNASGTDINEKDALHAGDRKTLTVFIKYRDDVLATELPNDDLRLDLNFSIKYVQADDSSNEI